MQAGGRKPRRHREFFDVYLLRSHNNLFLRLYIYVICIHKYYLRGRKLKSVIKINIYIHKLKVFIKTNLEP